MPPSCDPDDVSVAPAPDGAERSAYFETITFEAA